MIYKLNENNKVAVATPHGVTDRVDIDKIVMQGENLAPLECSVQVDSFGKECLSENKYLFFYRKTIPVPPLSMVDDLLCISNCGIKSLIMNSFINLKSNIKKLQFGENKCSKIHVGKNKTICPPLIIDKWKTKQVDDLEDNSPTVEDVYDGHHLIQDSKDQKYLGDIICNSGKNDKNIEARVKKGSGIIKQISAILDEVFFGKFYFKVAKIFRESLFINSVLLNSEAWYNLSSKNIDDLEKLDHILLRKILEVGQSVPTVFLHLELGTIPLRFVIKIRRILFFHYILKEKESSLLYQFLNAQMEEPLRGDWWSTVRSDLEDLMLDLSVHEIKIMSRDKFKTLINTTVKSRAFAWLLNKQSQSKKVKDISYSKLEIQSYLEQPSMTTNQAKFLFAARGKMLFLRANYPYIEDDKFCPLCSTGVEKVLDSQEHLLYCDKL